jgi:hypothetical protein
MAHEPKRIDIENEPALVRIVEEVRESGESRVLRIGDADVAVLQPLPVVDDVREPEPWREITEADWEAFRSSAGSWRGNVDADQLIKDIYASRDASVSMKAPDDR